MKVYVEYFEEIDSGFKEANQLANTMLKTRQLLLKYQTMWALRDIEEEFKADGGNILIEKSGRLQLNDFSESMMKKIKDRLIDSAYESIP